MKIRPLNKYAMLFLSMVLMSACSPGDHNSIEGIPACIQDKIEALKIEEKRNPAASVTQYFFNGELVFYIPPAAGDRMGELYNGDCQLICHPDGGITGQGDGKCTDFFDERKEEKLIWQDSRK